MAPCAEGYVPLDLWVVATRVGRRYEHPVLTEGLPPAKNDAPGGKAESAVET
jgi:hypothetical protein